ncbi:golvesin C-terminal-like domain-containing protein [Hymenobacter weizhouensis]|uniref:golvesin C-terminal-like domain-containing protein n=1 Tax=Hymenobacter sp. YIM 151500-1 TaxID=2987689 RepID=UPI002225BDAE|nr:LamG-like jellyroll fold domain-containing protein [Hymenobacter sp. YIM 151500-1]UYZ62047.1 LamG domain-containing protein [Hymenobacter sp. YIM 151500-1]
MNTHTSIPASRLLGWLLLGTAATLASCQKQEEVVAPQMQESTSKAENIGAAAGALAYWPLDGSAADASGSSSGTVVGATFEAGISGQALRFDGNDYVNVPAGRAYSPDGSISVWVKTTQTTAGRLVFNTQISPNEGTTDAMFLGLTDGKPQLFFGGAPSFDPRPFSLVGNRRVNDGQWHHVAATWALNPVEGFRATRLYVDGALVVNDDDGTGPDADGSTLADPLAGSFDFSRPIRLGASPTSAAFFVGSLDDVSIYNRALTAAEVTALAARPATPAPVEYIVDNQDAGFGTTGTWTTSTGLPGFAGRNYLHDGDALASPGKAATWASPITTPARAGTYAVYLRWTSAADRPDAAPVEVNYQGGLAQLTVNQRQRGGQWVLLGTWPFAPGSGDYVRLSATDAGFTIADAVRWVKQ